MSSVLKREYVTSAKGNLYNGYYAGQHDGLTVYACIPLGRSGVVGYCARDEHGISGPLCYTYDDAILRARVVSQVAQSKIYNKQK